MADQPAAYRPHPEATHSADVDLLVPHAPRYDEERDAWERSAAVMLAEVADRDGLYLVGSPAFAWDERQPDHLHAHQGARAKMDRPR